MTTPFKLKYKNSEFPFKSPIKHKGKDVVHPGPGKEGDEGYHEGHETFPENQTHQPLGPGTSKVPIEIEEFKGKKELTKKFHPLDYQITPSERYLSDD